MLSVAEREAERGTPGSGLPGWLPRLWLPGLGAAAVVTAALVVVVDRSRPAWTLLGAARGLVPEEALHVSGFVLVWATTFGQAAGWAGGSALGYHVLRRLGLGPPWLAARVAMTLVYLGLGAGPLLVYHVLFGGWLLDLPRVGLQEWLAARHPDARWLVLDAHRVVDVSLAPLGAAFLGLLWGTGERPRTHRGVQALLALALLATSMAVALSLAIHSILVHIRL